MSGTKRPREDSRQQKIPVSLGKPSLRLRLEAYYRLIAPDQIANQSEWRSRLDQIYEKFGGSHEGEAKLARKLYKKYGSAVQLELAKDAETDHKPTARTPSSSAVNTNTSKNSESWYQLRDNERNSRVVDFTSANFDPVEALRIRPQVVQATNPFVTDCPLLDRVDQFSRFLPDSDPLHRQVTVAARKTPSASQEPKTKPPSCFAAIASLHQEGPYSVLFRAFQMRHRVRVVVRYANGIRGTLTGSLLAFDKHFNLILRDAQELYSWPLHDTTESGVFAELQRRRQGVHKRRKMKQILVRGDSVVLVYKADQEQTAWPQNGKDIVSSQYRQVTAKQNIPPHERVGTPGSLKVSHFRPGAGRKRDYSSNH